MRVTHETTPMNRTRIVIIEDDAFTRTMIAGALQMQGLDVIGEASTVAPAIQMVERLKPDAIVVDLDLGNGPNGIDLAIAIRRKFPRIGIVILTTYEDPRLLTPNISLPPAGSEYLIKRKIGEIGLLYDAITKSIASAQTPNKNELIDKKKVYAMQNVSDSQLETMRLVAQGLSNAQIARVKSITEKSVEQSISRLVSHLDLPSGPTNNQRVQITKLYFQLTGAKSSNEN